jgi:UDP-N-acetylmuramoyl-L-alanyl-D-glutamate--2,6-diaminopimelate ligase
MKYLLSAYHYIVSVFAYWFYGRPARRIIVIGVTGTKGKSTTCRLIASALEAGGYNVGMLSTVEFQIGSERAPNDKKMTMLGRGQIQKMLHEMVKAGCQYAVVETSSEGILQYRHYGLHYDICIFTNLGTEHSERHGGFENLRSDKGKIFAGLKKFANKKLFNRVIEKIIVANSDDANAPYFLAFPADNKITYSLKDEHANVFGKILSGGAQGSEFQVGENRYRLNISGEFNVSNALAAIAVAESQHITPDKIHFGLDAVQSVAGRMEYIDEGQPFSVIVDYAHESLSLTGLFESLRKNTPAGKVISVIGSDGGGRDQKKRGRMGEVAGMLCDYVIVSDVNCFDEDPGKIAEMLAAGVRLAGKRDGVNLFVEIDRRKGIERALSLANPGDVVAITAKGTEPCIVVAHGRKISWDDRRVAREILHNLGFTKQ